MAGRKPKNIPVEVKGLDARFECPICLLCLKDPVLTSCGHRFCSTCIQSWLEKKNPCCPVDNKPLHERDLFPDNYTRREILTQTIPCTICEEHFSLSQIDDHLASHTTNECYFKDVGCDMEISPGTLKEHLEKEIHYHMRLLHSKVQPSRMDSKEDEVKLWEAGKELENSNALLRVLYERVVTLEQKSVEQESQIRTQKRDILSLEMELRDIALRHCFGEFLWKIENFREKIEGMRETQGFHLSPGFYTSPVGYKFCARINISPNNPEYLSIVIHLMKSENDISLPWPFTGTINLALLHPTQQNLTILDTMTPPSDLSAFGRPAREVNPNAYGYSEYVPIAHIENDEYLVNGALFIKILVQNRPAS